MVTENGQGLVEYSLILLLVALALIIVLSIFGTELAEVYSNIIELLP
jgi:Flp pilus assembly pilin Flp